MTEAATSEDVRKAAEYLLGVDVGQYKQVKARLIRAIAEHSMMPVKFTGEFEPLNPLLELGLQSPVQFEKVLVVVDRWREQTRTAAYHESTRERRNEYMKEYMREYRKKLASERRKPTLTMDLQYDLDQARKSKKPAPVIKKVRKAAAKKTKK